MRTTALQRSEFEQAAIYFKQQTMDSDSSWMLRTHSLLNYSYLERTTRFVSLQPRLISSLDFDLGTCDLMTIEHDDPATILDSSALPSITLNHHIVYSPSYQVPVLYFNAYFTDGTRLGLDDIYTHLVPSIYQQDLKTSPVQAQGSITQADHPILGCPFWYIHPCDTQTLLQTILFGAQTPPSAEEQELDTFLHDYIKTWLALLGPIIRCPVSPTLFMSPLLPPELV